MASKKSILLFTHAEYGQTNVMLATAYELLIHGEFDVHLASFTSYGVLQPRVIGIGKLAAEVDGASSITFHAIDGISMGQAFTALGFGLPFHSPWPKGTIASYKFIENALAPWDGNQYMKIFNSCKQIINKVDPAFIAVDPLFCPAFDVLSAIGSRKCAVLSPNALKDIIAVCQPHGAGLWKYPTMSSGFPFPIPWRYFFVNIYLAIRLAIAVLFSARVKILDHHRKENGIPDRYPLMVPYDKNKYYISPAIPETDFPFEYIPPNVTCCGPILLPSPPVSEIDPGLDKWLQRSSTILVNLGTAVKLDEKDTRALAIACKTILTRRPDVQVLWKLKLRNQFTDLLVEVLGKETDSDRVRVVDWLKAEPAAILQTGHVVCMINHGGANSYYDACYAGVPQIILPVWLDTYDYSARVEYLGIGIFGSKTAAPNINAEELGDALVEMLVDGPKADAFVEKARELGTICRATGGRKRAAEKLIELARGEVEK